MSHSTRNGPATPGTVLKTMTKQYQLGIFIADIGKQLKFEKGD